MTNDGNNSLSVYIGHRLDGNLVTTYSISLLAGSTVLNTVSGSNGSITAGQFAPVTLTYTTGSTVVSGNISIQLTSGGEQIDIDNVSLTYNSGTPSVTYYHQDQLSNRLSLMPTAISSRSLGIIPSAKPGTTPRGTSCSLPRTPATRNPATTTPWPVPTSTASPASPP